MLSVVPIATSLLVAGSGCLGDTDDDLVVSETSQAATVSTYVSGSCSTAVVIGLSKQIADQISCDSPTLLKRFTATGNLQVSSNAVLPYLHSTAKTDLESVAATRVVQVNSAFRALPQQYLLYRWFQQGRCGITAAATPGRSNHQSGRALDVANYSSLISAMSNRGWAHDVPGDAVHFDHLSSPDIRGKDVLAFQKLWNRNHPTDKIGEDGAYGPQTEARLKLAPATGFAIGPSCVTSSTALVADVISVDGPDRVDTQQRAHYSITIQNNSEREWPGSAVVRVMGTGSQLHDASWLSATNIASLGAAIPAHEAGELAFDITTPLVTEETPIFEELEISDGATHLGTVSIALTVIPGMGEEPTSSDSDDQYDQEVTGGCSAGGNGSQTGVVLSLALLALIRRRRR
ncbi:MAG TPA: M15 family metallopeptidase [Kofleriaceae bacterium]|nr:M15 family metallopeptidase [Kofleriaceae bacterium]